MDWPYFGTFIMNFYQMHGGGFQTKVLHHFCVPTPITVSVYTSPRRTFTHRLRPAQVLYRDERILLELDTISFERTINISVHIANTPRNSGHYICRWNFPPAVRICAVGATHVRPRTKYAPHARRYVVNFISVTHACPRGIA